MPIRSPAVAARQPLSSQASSPAAEAAAAAAAAAMAASSAASRPGTSAQPGQATISGPSSASAAVAAAIRAVRDEGLTRTPAASSDEESGECSSYSPWMACMVLVCGLQQAGKAMETLCAH